MDIFALLGGVRLKIWLKNPHQLDSGFFHLFVGFQLGPALQPVGPTSLDPTPRGGYSQHLFSASWLDVPPQGVLKKYPARRPRMGWDPSVSVDLASLHCRRPSCGSSGSVGMGGPTWRKEKMCSVTEEFRNGKKKMQLRRSAPNTQTMHTNAHPVSVPFTMSRAGGHTA